MNEIKLPNVITPFPGTPFYDKLIREGKVLYQNWRVYDTNHLVFNAGKWTSEIINWGRKYIFDEFEKSRN